MDMSLLSSSWSWRAKAPSSWTSHSLRTVFTNQQRWFITGLEFTILENIREWKVKISPSWTKPLLGAVAVLELVFMYPTESKV